MKETWYPFDRRLGGYQSRSGGSGEEKNFQPLVGLEPPDHPLSNAIKTLHKHTSVVLKQES
jgi:hypothetical protein